MPDTASHASTRRQARTDGGGGGEKESSVPELCSLESVCGQACLYRNIARCVFTTIFINHKYSCSGVFNFNLTLENSNFIYQYACRCERTYVGETCQRFSERIKQHIPDKLYKKPPDKRVATSDSAITKHLQAQPECIPQERNSSFSVITPARNSAHRFTLEALYIRSLRPELCRQKKHIKVLRLFKLQPD